MTTNKNIIQFLKMGFDDIFGKFTELLTLITSISVKHSNKLDIILEDLRNINNTDNILFNKELAGLIYNIACKQFEYMDKDKSFTECFSEAYEYVVTLVALGDNHSLKAELENNE